MAKVASKMRSTSDRSVRVGVDEHAVRRRQLRHQARAHGLGVGAGSQVHAQAGRALVAEVAQERRAIHDHDAAVGRVVVVDRGHHETGADLPASARRCGRRPGPRTAATGSRRPRSRRGRSPTPARAGPSAGALNTSAPWSSSTSKVTGAQHDEAVAKASRSARGSGRRRRRQGRRQSPVRATREMVACASRFDRRAVATYRSARSVCATQ